MGRMPFPVRSHGGGELSSSRSGPICKTAVTIGPIIRVSSALTRRKDSVEGRQGDESQIVEGRERMVKAEEWKIELKDKKRGIVLISN